jgi:DNA-binding NarL/FixJ family response regulator
MSALLERDREIAALEGLVGDARAGSGRLVLIEGPAGIGKSGLLRELRARRELRVLAARASELEREFAFGVVRQLFEADAATRPELALAGAAAPAGAVFASAPGSEEDTSFAALHGLFWLTLNLAAEQPLLLAIDDLHWCDRPSLRFLAYLARRLDGVAALVAATLRSGEPGNDPVLLGEIAGDPATLPLRPGPLGPGGVAALVRAELSADADAAFCAACHEATGGNPLLLRQLLRTLEAEGIQPDLAHVDAVGAVGPRAVSSTVLLRLARLSAEAAAVAQTVSVLGEGAQLPVVASLAELDEDTVATAAHALVRAEILRPEPPLAFVHPLVRDAVYHELPPGTRELAHERAAAALRAAGAPIEQVAAQLLAAPRRGAAWVVELLEEAARAAMGKGAAESAVAYLRRALEEPPEPDRHTDVLLTLARVETYVSGPAGAARLRAAYDLVSEPEPRAQVAVQLARTLMFVGDVEESVVVAREAAAALPPELADLARWLEAHELATMWWGTEPGERLERLVHHRSLPADDGPGSNGLAALAALAWAYTGGSAERCAPLALAALRSADLIRLDNGVVSVGSVLALTLADRDEAMELLEHALAEAYRSGSMFSLSGAQMWQGFIRLRRGDLADAETLIAAPIETNERWGFGYDARRFNFAHLAMVALERGDSAAGWRALNESSDTGQRGESSRLWLVARARLLAADARWEEALAAAEEIAERFAWVTNPAASGWRAPAVLALDALGRHTEAVALAEENLRHARAWGAPGTVGPALRLLAGLYGADGLPLLEEAVTVLAPSTARLEYAKALAAMGTALRLAKRPTDAREPLRNALELAAACDAAGLAEHVRTELYATGTRPRTDAQAGVAALTASERRVVERAAGGETNRDIAQALFVTPKTVEVHLSNAYRKLGVRSRRELPGALAAA